MTVIETRHEELLASFEPFLADRVEREPGWLVELRRDALARLSECGLPTTRDEEWKYTSVASFARIALEPPRPPTAPAIDLGRALSAAKLSGWPGPVAVFVNGAFEPGASRLQDLPPGVCVSSLAAAMARAAAIGDILREPQAPADGFAHLNSALATDGALVEVADRAVAEQPLLLLFLSAPDAGGSHHAWHIRNGVAAGLQSQIEIVEIHAVLDAGCYLNNSSTQLQLGTGAVVTHTRLQCEDSSGFHVGRIQATVGQDASFTSRAVSLGAALARQDVAVKLARPGASCVLDGLYLAAGAQHVDFHTAIDHAQPHTTSCQLYKGILAGAATGVFNGKVVVQPGAQKTSAQQTNRNLLLSSHAQINTKPQLEIFADDVKCSHGATIGQLDAGAIFYLRSRGLSPKDARQLMVRAFANEVLSRIGPASLRDSLAVILEAAR